MKKLTTLAELARQDLAEQRARRRLGAFSPKKRKYRRDKVALRLLNIDMEYNVKCLVKKEI